MTYKCLIVDDEELARELIETHLSQLSEFEVVASCGSAIEASKILQNENIDLMFLDIEMPVLKGTEFFKNLIKKPSVIFTTAYRDYAVDGFNLNAIDYLLKPISFSRFFNGIEKFLNLVQPNIETTTDDKTEEKDEFIYIQKSRKHIKVQFNSILFVESKKDYIELNLDKERHLFKYNLSSFLELLDERFVRVHRSYIINKDKITAFTKHDVEIGEIEIPIGDNYKQHFLEQIDKK